MNWMTKKGLPAVFFLHQLRQGLGVLTLAVHGIGNQVLDMVERQWCERNLGDPDSRLSDPSNVRRRGSNGRHFVVAISAHQQQIANVRMSYEMPEKIERRRIQPLQVVEKQRQRVFLPREYADESPEHHLEAFLRFQRGQIPNRGCLPMMSSSSGMRLTMSAPFAPMLPEGAAAIGELLLALSNIGGGDFEKACASVAYGMSRLYWSNLPDANRPRGGTSALVQLVHHRGLADAGIS